HVDVWKGIILVCFGAERPTPIADWFGDGDLGGYDFDAMKLAAVKSHTVEADWKIVVENSNECYHCVVIHPELTAVFDPGNSATDDFDAVVAMRVGGVEAL